jgi:hypothetical protein
MLGCRRRQRKTGVASTAPRSRHSIAGIGRVALPRYITPSSRYACARRTISLELIQRAVVVAVVATSANRNPWRPITVPRHVSCPAPLPLLLPPVSHRCPLIEQIVNVSVVKILRRVCVRSGRGWWTLLFSPSPYEY